MSYLMVLILGIVRGIAGVLPLSSSGLSALAGRIMGTDIYSDPVFQAVAGAGVLLAVFFVWRKEIVKTLAAFFGIVSDLAANLLILILGKNIKYRKIICSAYRKIAVMLLISIVPSVIITTLSGAYVRTLSGNLLASCIGMLLTAMILMVASFAVKHNKGPKESGMFPAVITGLFYGFSVFPGISKIGTAAAGGFISEFTPRFTAAYAFLLYFFTGVPAVLTGLLSAEGTQTGIPECIIGAAAAAAAAYWALRKLRKRIKASGSIQFAICNACAGVVLMILHFV